MSCHYLVFKDQMGACIRRSNNNTIFNRKSTFSIYWFICLCQPFSYNFQSIYDLFHFHESRKIHFIFFFVNHYFNKFFLFKTDFAVNPFFQYSKTQHSSIALKLHFVPSIPVGAKPLTRPDLDLVEAFFSRTQDNNVFIV